MLESDYFSLDKETSKNVSNRLLKSITVTDDGCWESDYSTCHDGYPGISVNGSRTKASRVAYFLAYGKYTKKLLVLHRCNNRKCINPNHLYLGTHQQNSDDMTKSGRAGKAILNKEQVKEIVKMLRYDKYTYHEIGKRFGVSDTYIADIARGKSWNWLTGLKGKKGKKGEK